MSFFSNQLRRFIKDEKGTILVDGIIIMPMFIWAYAGLFVYWDAYRTINTVQKASYTISDLLSRSQGPVNDAYINGMRGTLNYMINSDVAGDVRVTSYRWSETQNRYEVIFSRSANNAMAALNNADLEIRRSRLPIMPDGDAAILVETRVQYEPPIAFGLDARTLEQFIVTRPRFLPKLCHVNVTC